MDLSAEEVRVLGCLVEKERTTPDQYPLTTNALRSACNQKTNRDPVVDYLERTVDAAMLSLRDRHLARTVVGGGRAAKHRHVLGEAWGLDDGEVAVLAVLALRGPQTPGELRGRSERMTPFATPEDVVAVLDALAARDEPLVVQLGRRAGQKETRWAHLLSGETEEPEPGAWSPVETGSRHEVEAGSRRESVENGESAAAWRGPGEGGGAEGRVEELESEVAALRDELEALRDRVDRLVDLLGADEV
ncbi:MAG: DUF480 domain-containing protein [Acidimicrobiia bacterium]|nr:DUF480 domain-containing protein [Acidimicrobiia bacterium]